MGVERIEPGELEKLGQATPRKKRVWLKPEDVTQMLQTAQKESASIRAIDVDHERAVGRIDARLRPEALASERAKLSREYAAQKEPHLTRLAQFKAQAQEALEVWGNPRIRLMLHSFDATNDANDATIRLATMARLAKLDSGRLLHMARLAAARDQHALAGAILEEMDSREGFDRTTAAEIRAELATLPNPSEGIESTLRTVMLEYDQHTQSKIATGLQRTRIAK